MTIQKAIESAIEGGWHPGVPEGYFAHGMNAKDKADYMQGMSIHHLVLDPKFWQALGKTMRWPENEYHCSFGSQHPALSFSYRGMAYVNDTWQERWHRMIDTLISGSSIEDYLATL